MTPSVSGLNIQLLNADHCQLDSSWQYGDVISPFSRLYLISSGMGYIYPNNLKTELEPGYLYLIPAYVPCSYVCNETLEQYYLHFATHSNDGSNIFDPDNVLFKVKASDTDFRLFDRLLELNPDVALRVADPKVSQQKNWLNNEFRYHTYAHYFESIGLVYQLFSKFFISPSVDSIQVSDPDNRIRKSLKYIHQHLSDDISVKELACKACLSIDHFARAFKKITSQTPLDYINQKRVEKAQFLLVTTNRSLKDIIEKSGFNSASYFNRIFKIYTGFTPLEYRKNQQMVVYR